MEYDHRLAAKIRSLEEVLETGAWRQRVSHIRSLLEKKMENEIIYGLNTGFGALKEKIIPPQDRAQLQYNLIRSHAIGTPEYAPFEVVKLTVLFRAYMLSKGYSGVRPEVIQSLFELYKRNIYVYVPLEGSVGASGDLAPLAHIALALIGEGYVIQNGRIVPIKKAYPDFPFIDLKEKEGLALINGTSYSLAWTVWNFVRLYNLFKLALDAVGLAYEALKGNVHHLHPFIHKKEVSGQKSQEIIAKALLKRLEGSKFVIDSVKGVDQEPYSLRCVPQILAPVYDTLKFIYKGIINEIERVSDNPLVDEKGNVYSGGNFHAQYLANLADYMKICAGNIAVLLERILARMVDKNHNKGLPAFLTKDSGLSSGLMILQYVVASQVAKIRNLACPSSIQSIPTCANQEDVVSMAPLANITLSEILDSLSYVTASLIYTSLVGIKLREAEGLTIDKLSYYNKKLWSLYINKLGVKLDIAEKDTFYEFEVFKIINFMNMYARGVLFFAH